MVSAYKCFSSVDSTLFDDYRQSWCSYRSYCPVFGKRSSLVFLSFPLVVCNNNSVVRINRRSLICLNFSDLSEMKLYKYFIGFLILILSIIVIAIFQIPDGNLHIITCNVGQGDAILTVYKNIQILTDGGPDKKVLDCLGRHLPFWDRSLELVISTHPDADHSTGLIDVVKNYKVASLFINPIDSGTQVIKVLQNEVGSKGIPVTNPVAGAVYRVGLIYLDIVNPTSSDLSLLTAKIAESRLGFYKPVGATNTYSISYKLSLGEFVGLFPGDITPAISDKLAENKTVGRVDYIKIPHHGSVNGLTQNLLEKIMPSGGLHPGAYSGVGVISVGKNSYGLPDRKILEMLSKENIKTYRTDEVGDIEIITDGKNMWRKRN